MLQGTGFFQLPRELIVPLWDEIRPFAESAAERSQGMWDITCLNEFLVNFLYQAWVYIEDGKIVALVVSRIEPFPTGLKVLWVETATGEHRERWQRLAVDTLEEFARGEGCGLIRLVARPGWQRVFRDYEVSHVLLDKRLSL